MITSEVFCTDCLEYMRALPDKAFDLAIADPPYGIGADCPKKKMSYVKQPNGTFLRINSPDYGKKDWDADIPPTAFFDELNRVSRHQIIWGANYYGLKGGMLVWDKMNGESDQYGCEIAYQSFDQRTDIVHYLWRGMIQGAVCSADVTKANRQKGDKRQNERRIHPCQKPVALYTWLLRRYAEDGYRIFDPMMGSQSLRIACYRMGLDYVGCEIDQEYFELGNERFNQECIVQPSLL